MQKREITTVRITKEDSKRLDMLADYFGTTKMNIVSYAIGAYQASILLDIAEAEAKKVESD